MLRYVGATVTATNSEWQSTRDDQQHPEYAGHAIPQSRAMSTGPRRQVRDHPCPLVAKISKFVALNGDDVETLDGLCRNARTVDAEHNLIQEGASPGFVCVILGGLAYRYKLLAGGHRQIMGYLIPGDVCDLSFTILDRADYSVSVLTESRVAKIPVRKFAEVLAANPSVTRGLHLAAHLDTVIMREWLLNVGQRKAHQKLSHFLCEMAIRLNMAGEIGDDGSFDFPLNQAMLADTVGLTAVHINRTLQRLRSDGLIALRRRRLRIVDMQRLAAIANFEGNYLKIFDIKE